MLNHLKLRGIGPVPELDIELASRVNFLTGDNGLGKSFVLDVAWWALTRTWARGVMVRPNPDAGKATIAHSYGQFSGESEFARLKQQWPVKRGRPPIPGVILYAGVDGSFSVWDPARNYWKDQQPERPRSFDFSPPAVWDGLTSPEGTKVCNGLIHDWVYWQVGRKPEFDDLAEVLKSLSPSLVERLLPGEPMRVGDDVIDYPSLRMPYGMDVPLIHASAAMRRIAALAYLLVWAWREHQLACKRLELKPAQEIVFLIDEIECHLHPQWQRRVVPALLGVMEALTGSQQIPVQLIAATHSPLVLASLEPDFDETRDRIWDFNLVAGAVQVREFAWNRKGDVNAWLASEAFGLREPRSWPAEVAIQAAKQLLFELGQPNNGKQIEDSARARVLEADEALRRALADVDPFWVRWGFFRDEVLRGQ